MPQFGSLSPLPDNVPKPRAVHGLVGKMQVGAYSGEPGPVNGTPRQSPPPRPATGDALETLLISIGIYQQLAPETATDGGCCTPCKTLKGRMNTAGIIGTRSQAAEFAKELRDRAGDYSLWDWTKAAALAVANGLAFKLNPLDPFPGLIEEACRIEEERIAKEVAAREPPEGTNHG